MCVICKNEYRTLSKINCYDCETLTEIPNIEGLIYLNCSNCPNLCVIANIRGLKELDCSNCPNLLEIPNIEGLQTLYCFNCEKINSIPNIKGLIELDCANCLIKTIPEIKELKILFCDKHVDIPNISLHELNGIELEDFKF